MKISKWTRCWKYSRLLCTKCLFCQGGAANILAERQRERERDYYSDCCLTVRTVSSILHFVRDATSTKGRTHAAGRVYDSSRSPKKSGLSRFSLENQRCLSNTYLTALRLRHFSPEEHAAGWVLNSHKSRQKKNVLTLDRSTEKTVRAPRCSGSFVLYRKTILIHTPNCSVLWKFWDYEKTQNYMRSQKHRSHCCCKV